MFANIKIRSTIQAAYTEIDHNNYLDHQGQSALTACVEIIETADENGVFNLEHGFYPEKTQHESPLRLPIQGRYDLMLDWIEQVAKDGQI